MAFRIRLSPSGPFIGNPPAEIDGSFPGVVLRVFGVSAAGSGNVGVISAAPATILQTGPVDLDPGFIFDVSARLWALEAGSVSLSVDLEVNGTSWIPIPQFSAGVAVGAPIEVRTAGAPGTTMQIQRRIAPTTDLGVGPTNRITGFRLTASAPVDVDYMQSSVYLRSEQFTADA